MSSVQPENTGIGTQNPGQQANPSEPTPPKAASGLGIGGIREPKNQEPTIHSGPETDDNAYDGFADYENPNFLPHTESGLARRSMKGMH